MRRKRWVLGKDSGVLVEGNRGRGDAWFYIRVP